MTQRTQSIAEQAAAVSADKPACRNCALHRMGSPIIGDPGKCAWAPPPAVARLYAVLAVEHATQVDYVALFNTLPDALSHGACHGYQRKLNA